jgi:hypothetical protein
MQKKTGNYEKTILILAALLALGAVGYMIWDSQSLPDRLAISHVIPKNEMNPPPTERVKSILQRLSEKVSWVSPEIKGKPVPLNKSILLLQKGDQLYDLQVAEPVLRPPMTNEFLVKNDLPNIESPNVGALDPDNDGFTNEEEFTDKTNPRDEKSHPPVTKKLYLKQRITHDYIIKLNSSSPPYQVQRMKPEPRASKFVSPGDEFGFDREAATRFKALEFTQKVQRNPTTGLETDVSELKCLDNSTKREFVLVKAKETNLADYEAELEFRIGTPEIRKVREGETFQIPGIGATFRLLSIDENQAVIVPVEGDKPSGEQITVKKG